MKNPSIKYIVITVLLVIFVVASLVVNQRTGTSTVSSETQEGETSSYIPQSEPVRVDAPSQPVPQQVVIQFAPDATEAERAAYIESIGGTVVESIDSLDTIVVNVPEEVAQAPLPESTAVASSEADYYVAALDEVAPVNDPHYVDQWALPAIAAPEAWAAMSADAPAVTIAVIDSGICVTHPDLNGRIVSGWDFVEGDAVPQDDFGHGCAVSGVIAANMNDGIGIAGVAPNANIMPLRVLNSSGFGSYSDVAAAVVFAVDNGAQVINLSLGGSSPSSTLENAINYAVANGVVVVAAAGNNGTEGALYPAAYDSVVAVGSIDPNLAHSSFSNYGSQVDVWAPGRDIMTTKRTGDYGLVSGTSFAAPYVAGAEAVYMALSRTPVFAGGLLTFSTQIEVTAEPTTVVEVTPTDVPVTEISDAAVLEQLRSIYNLPADRDAFVQTIQQAGGTLFGLFIIPAPDNAEGGPSAHYFTAVQNGDSLTISQEYTPKFAEALDALAAEGVVDQGVVDTFNSPTAQGDGTAQLGLPWTTGANATFVAGPHGDGFQPFPTEIANALDFAPADNKVRAAREGFAQQIVCPGQVQSSWVIVTHPGGWRTSYYQVSNIQVDPDGLSVGRGAYLGDLAANSASALRCGGNNFTSPLVHFSVLQNGKQVKINGFDIGGWTVGTTTMTKVSDASVVNVGGTLSNNGTYGTNLTCDATVLPPDYIKCADEGGTCSFPGLETVYFGSDGCFGTEAATTSISCDSGTFGMPAGDSRSCYVDSKSTTLSPACPQSGGVILYWAKDFSCTNAASDAGYRLQAASGSQDYGVDTAFNDKASALRVPTGWSVMLYGGAANSGEMLCVNKDVSDLSLLGTFPNSASEVNDGISSMQVFANTNCGGVLNSYAPPQNLLPLNGSSNANNFDLNFQWAAAPMGGSYYVEWWNNNTPNTKNFCNWSTALNCDIAGTPAAGTYSWHVRAFDGVDYSGWSQTFTFTIRTSANAIFLDHLAITDELGPAGLGDGSPSPAEYVEANAYKDIFLPGDPIRLYIYYTNQYPTNEAIDFEWLVTDPAGRIVPEMSETAVDTSNNANNSWYWHRAYAIPDDAIRGTYTFTGKVTYNSVTTTQSQTFTITGSPSVEVHDAFSTTSLGVASVDGGPGVPEASIPSDVISKATPTYNAGDNIRLYIDSFNDTASAVNATFTWQVLDPIGRHVPQLEWAGTLSAAVGHTWWSLPATIPSYMGTGDYVFTGTINNGGHITSQSQTFHVNGLSAPANDNWANRITIGSATYTNTQDTWNATSENDDPSSSCGGTNSNSVWYRYTPASNGLLEIDTTGTDYPVEIGVWTGASLASLTQFACSNELDIVTGDVAIKNMSVTSGTTYYIELTDVGTPGGGKLKLSVNFISSASLTNDGINNAATITNNITINNAGANITPLDVRSATVGVEDRALDTCNRAIGKATVWYKYITTLPGDLVLDTGGSNYDTMLSVWEDVPGSGLSLISCNDDIGGGVWDVDSHLLAQLKASTTYYIQVAEFNGVSENSNSLSLDGIGNKPPVSAEFDGGTLHLFSQFNPAPILDLPADNTYTDDTTPTLSLSTTLLPSGAATYHFQVDDSSDFSSALVNTAGVAGTSYTVTAGEALPSGVYYWRVAAQDGSANYSAWSASRTLNITSLISPTNNSVTSNTKPTFSWGASAGALEYNLQIDESTSFAAVELDRLQAGTSFTLTTALVPGDHYWRVRVRTGTGWGGFTPPWKFTILQALVAPVLENPAASFATTDRTPSFSWFSVPAGNTYNIQIDTDATFATPDVDYTTLPGNPISYQQPTDLPDGTYSWRVRALNVLGEFGPWSTARTFTIDNVASDAPLLNLPADNAYTALSKPTFSVFAVTGAASYTIYVDTEPFTNPAKVPFVFQTGITTTSYTLNDAQVLPYGVYYWRMRAKDAAGNNSSWSVIRTLYVTPMTAPANNGFVTTATPNFTWVAATGALEYNLQVAKTADFASIEMERLQTSGTSYTSPALDYGSHYWRIRVRTATGWGSWAPAWKFTVSPALTAAPVLVSPAVSAVVADNTPTLTWNKVMDDDRYEIQIDNLSTFASPEQTSLTSFNVLNYTATTLPDGIYYWRVRNTNYLDVGGTWSTSRSFTVDTTPPAAPNLSAPADAASNIGTPAFSWAAPTTATKYQFEYDNNSDFSSPTYTSAELTTTSHTPSPAMALGLHYWHVRARDAAGNWSSWSASRSITINPPIPLTVTVLSPAASAVTNDNTPDFTWNALGVGTPYTYTYEIQFATASTFAAPLPQSATGLAVTNYTPASLFTDGVIYWRVRGVNVNNVTGPWSTSRSFTVDTIAPLAPSLTAPADAAAVTTSPAFTWAAATTASKYQFAYDSANTFDSNGGNALYTSAELTTTSHTPPSMLTPPLPKTYYWHVRAKDAAGNWSPWSVTRSLQINPATPLAPTLTLPAAS
ncbi:MAG TPA: S8 family serine peptidase, partial [Anaerolineales bacterium]|nr:S8 family serine peptidase [Anaerolineales bacterium]